MSLFPPNSHPINDCNEGNWIGIPAGPIFRAVNDNDSSTLSELLEKNKYQERVNDLDGDGVSALHILAFSSADYSVSKEIVDALKSAGADVDIRSYNGETPLMIAACYAHYGPLRALLEANATVDFKDRRGRTALERIESPSMGASKDHIHKCHDLLKEASISSEGTNVERAEDMRKLGNLYFGKRQWKKAEEMYTKSLSLMEDHRTYANRAAVYLNDASDRAMMGVPGYRQLSKSAWLDAEKAVSMDNTYEKGWYRLAMGYILYRELPRAKQAARNGQINCPDSKNFDKIWNVLDSVGVPDEVADHDKEEFKDILHKLYVEHWMGSVGCTFCGLSCMDEPVPKRCPFCACPTDVKLSDEDNDSIFLLVNI